MHLIDNRKKYSTDTVDCMCLPSIFKAQLYVHVQCACIIYILYFVLAESQSATDPFMQVMRPMFSNVMQNMINPAQGLYIYTYCTCGGDIERTAIYLI